MEFDIAVPCKAKNRRFYNFKFVLEKCWYELRRGREKRCDLNEISPEAFKWKEAQPEFWVVWQAYGKIVWSIGNVKLSFYGELSSITWSRGDEFLMKKKLITWTIKREISIKTEE